MQVNDKIQKVLSKEGRLKIYLHGIKQDRQCRTFQSNEKKLHQEARDECTKTYLELVDKGSKTVLEQNI